VNEDHLFAQLWQESTSLELDTIVSPFVSTVIFVALHVQFVNSLGTCRVSNGARCVGDDRQNTLSYLSLSIFSRFWSTACDLRIHAINSSSMTAMSPGRRGSLISTSHWRSSDSGFVIIRRCRGRSRSSVWRVVAVVCRRWNPSRSPWCRDGRVCRRRKSCHWSSIMSFPSGLWRAHSRRSGSYTPFVVWSLGYDGRLRRLLSPAITPTIIHENRGNFGKTSESIKKNIFGDFLHFIAL